MCNIENKGNEKDSLFKTISYKYEIKNGITQKRVNSMEI